MIKLNRNDEPEVCKINKASWMAAIDASVITYGSFKEIPEKEKEKLIRHYRHEDIKKSIGESSFWKCAFCECVLNESGYLQVEHFKPKSIYYKNIFDWDNLLPICGPCNQSKLDHDSVKEPIVNPYSDDPENYFYFDFISMRAKKGSQEKIAARTIEVLGLESIRLWKPRTDILLALTNFSDSIHQAIILFEEADTERKRRNRLRKLTEAIQIIEETIKEYSKYSAFSKYYLSKCEYYKKSKEIVRHFECATA